MGHVKKEAGDVSMPMESTRISQLEDTAATEGDMQHSTFAQGDAKYILGGLNHRLATYIEKVRELEDANEHLVLKYRELEVEKRTIEARKTDSKALIADLRKQKEDAESLRIRAEINQKKFENEATELRKQVELYGQEIGAVTDDRNRLENRLARTNNDLNSAETRCLKLETELGFLKKDLTTVFQQNDVLKSQLKEETVLRANLQNRIDSELSMYKNLLEEEEQRLHIRTPEVSMEATENRSANTSAQLIKHPKQKQEFVDIKPGKRRRFTCGDN